MTDAPAATAPPPRYAVQRPKGKKWDTLHVDEDQDNALVVFRQVVATLPRSYVRVIVVEYDSTGPASDFRWRLVELYDPYKAGARSREEDDKRKRKKAKREAAASRVRAPGEKVRAPVRMYVWAIMLGLVAGAFAFYWIGTHPPA